MSEENQDIEREEDFDDIFDDITSESEPVEPEPEEEVAPESEPEPEEVEEEVAEEEQAEEEPAESEPEDIWANVPDRVKAEYDNLKSELEQANHHIKSNEGRVRAAQKFFQTQHNTKEPPVPAPSPRAFKEALADSEKWQQLSKDFPDVTEMIDEYGQRVREDYESRIAQLEQKVRDEFQPSIQRLEQGDQQRHIQAELQKLSQLHPDWSEVNQSSDFRNWVNRQPPVIQNALSSYDAADNAAVLDKFKQEQKVAELERQINALNEERDAQTQRAKKLEKSRTTAPTNSAAMPKGGVPDDFDAAWDAIPD